MTVTRESAWRIDDTLSDVVRPEAQSDYSISTPNALKAAISDVIARRQSIQSLASAMITNLPAQLCCVFTDTQHKLDYIGGMEARAGEHHHRPASRLRARLTTIAQRASDDRTIRQQNASQAHAAWQSLLIVPLQTILSKPLGIIILGNQTRAFTAAEIADVQAVLPTIALVLAAQAPQESTQTILHDVLAASGIHTLDDQPNQAPPSLADISTILFHATDEALLLIDTNYTIQLVNPALQRIAEWDTTVVGQRCMEVIACRDAAGNALCGTANCPLMRVTLPTLPPAQTVVHVATGRQATCAVSVNTVPISPDSDWRVLLLHDERPVIAATRQRDEFLAEVSHKMRNRLNTIHGFIELVAGGHAGAIGERQQQLLSYAHTSSIELMEYVENLLYLTRVDSKQLALRFEALDIGEMLEEVEHYTALEASNAEVLLLRDVLPPLPTIQGDRERLRQALMNLTTNAIKFTMPGGTVRLSAYAADGAMTVLIADTGIGIAPVDRPRIFERDYQSERTARMGKSGGGLGLATAKVIVEQHGGAIHFETEIDLGTTFFVQLPAPTSGHSLHFTAK